MADEHPPKPRKKPQVHTYYCGVRLSLRSGIRLLLGGRWRRFLNTELPEHPKQVTYCRTCGHVTTQLLTSDALICDECVMERAFQRGLRLQQHGISMGCGLITQYQSVRMDHI